MASDGAPSALDDDDSIGSASRPVSPGASKVEQKPKSAAIKPAAAPKGKKGRVQIQDSDEGGTGVKELQQMLREANDELAKRAAAHAKMEQQLKEAQDKQADLVRSGAKRLVQIATLERQLEVERTRGKRMMDELVKQTKMMDLVLNFRDQECARDIGELTLENTELADKLDVWKERAQMLQQERWGFVQRFRSAKTEAAKSPGGGDGSSPFDAMAAPVDPDASDSDEEGEGSDADDW